MACSTQKANLFYRNSLLLAKAHSGQYLKITLSLKNMATYFRAEVETHFLSQMVTILMEIVQQYQLVGLKYPAQPFYMLTLNLKELLSA